MFTTVRHPVLRPALMVIGAFLLLMLGASAAQANVEQETEFVQLINESRSALGLPALRVAPDLTTVARGHTSVMLRDQRLFHNPGLGDEVQNWRRVTENVGVGGSVNSLDRAFISSPSHRANILDPLVTQVGIGVRVDDGRIWVTAVFRLPMDLSKTPDLDVPTSTIAPSTSVDPGSVPLWGDWDGNGSETPGRFHNGLFKLSNRIDGTGDVVTLRYGQAGDRPIVGDWDGNGTDTIGVVRGNLFILRNEYRSGAKDIVLRYGRATDKPVAGDWDGDGSDTIGVVRGNLFILRNEYRSGAKDILMAYGQATDTPVVGDWDGDGTDTLGVVRGDLWILRNEYVRGAQDIVMTYGRASDHKLVGDFNGDGTDTLGIVRDDRWVLRYAYRRGADITLDY
jgi:hypothetical protein